MKSVEDTADRLGETQFGYQSLHFIVKIPNGWSSLPMFRGCDAFSAEIQLRTMAQHIWAAASHDLQYKHESGVPVPVRRSIHRVSALLETVDLEFERVLQERENYLASPNSAESDEDVNVDNLTRVLTESLPSENYKEPEDYGKLLEELRILGIDSLSKVRTLIAKHLGAALEKDKKFVEDRRREKSTAGTTQSRLDQGVFFTHVGLIRSMFEYEIGPDWRSKRLGDLRK